MNENKRIKLTLILSSIALIIPTILIILIFLIGIKMPKMLKEFVTDDISITSLESFDFIEDKTIFEYPNDNLGITGKLILDCYTGICHKMIYHKRTRHYCNTHLFFQFCYDVDESWYEPRENIEHYCSEQCHETDKVECDCKEPYDEKGKCQRNMDDTYKEGKVCFDYNTIHFWKGKKYIVLKKNIFSYLENAILKEEECPEGTKNCGIIDDNENKLCIKSNLKCPINYLSEQKLSNDFSSVLIGDKTFYYGNDNTKKRKIIKGLVADTDLLLNKDNDKKDIIDNYTISGFLQDNQNLYKDINLGYDPYKDNDIDTKGNSYLRIFYNSQNINLSSLRNQKESKSLNQRINKNFLNVIHDKTAIIIILGLISLIYLLLILTCIISCQIKSYKNWSDKGTKCCYFLGIIIFIGLIIVPLIFSCINISIVIDIEKLKYKNKYSTFKILNMLFVVLGFALILYLIVYIILIPIKCGFKENDEKKRNENVNNNTKNSSNEQIN